MVRWGKSGLGLTEGTSYMPTGLPIHQYQFVHPSKYCTNTNDISLQYPAPTPTPTILPFNTLHQHQHQRYLISKGAQYLKVIK
jgi:hypothetical protein